MTRRWEQGSWSPFLRVYVAVIPTVVGIGIFGVWSKEVFGPVASAWIEWRAAVLDLLLVGWLVAAATPLRLMTLDRMGRAARVTLALISAAFALWILIIFELVPIDDDGARGWVLLLSAPVFGALSLPLLPDAGRSIWPVVRWVGLAAAVGSTGILLVELPWSSTPGQRLGHWTLAVGLAAAAVTVAAGIALESAKGPPWRRWVHRITLGTIALEGAVLTILGEESFPLGDRWLSVLVSLGLLILVGLTTSVVLDAAGRAAERARGAVASLSEVRLSCPRCSRSVVIPLSAATPCSRCGLVIEVTVRQECCLACGYSRTGIPPGSACPECGAEGASDLSAGRT